MLSVRQTVEREADSARLVKENVWLESGMVPIAAGKRGKWPALSWYFCAIMILFLDKLSSKSEAERVEIGAS